MKLMTMVMLLLMLLLLMMMKGRFTLAFVHEAGDCVGQPGLVHAAAAVQSPPGQGPVEGQHVVVGNHQRLPVARQPRALLLLLRRAGRLSRTSNRCGSVRSDAHRPELRESGAAAGAQDGIREVD